MYPSADLKIISYLLREVSNQFSDEAGYLMTVSTCKKKCTAQCDQAEANIGKSFKNAYELLMEFLPNSWARLNRKRKAHTKKFNQTEIECVYFIFHCRVINSTATYDGYFLLVKFRYFRLANMDSGNNKTRGICQQFSWVLDICQQFSWVLGGYDKWNIYEK